MTTSSPRTYRTFRDLERAALDAHRTGTTWSMFWPAVADDVARLEPYHHQKYRRLVERLLHIWASGDESGVEPPGSCAWEIADAPAGASSDTETRARCLWSPTP